MTSIEREINELLTTSDLQLSGKDNLFYFKFVSNLKPIISLFRHIYGKESDMELKLLFEMMIKTWKTRPDVLKKRDGVKETQANWYTNQNIAGMSLYVDRFAKDLKTLKTKLPYLTDLGINLIHLMPVMESPENESDGGYAVSDFRAVDARFGTLNDLANLQTALLKNDMYLMMDVVINHTSHLHDWALQAKKGNKTYQDYFYTFDDRTIPDQYEVSMPEIFPHSSPGNFIWSPEMNKWVMTVFNYYQWDLNYTNPSVFLAMMDTIFFYGNLGVDILRLDAPAFIWKKLNTTCQNLEEAHKILQLFRACVDVATPGMALLGEAIVAPHEIMKYFGNDEVQECSLAYNATQMALQWDALATSETSVMLHSQGDIYHKPLGCTWINYTRCHDDIGLGFTDNAIQKAGFNPYEHRKFLKDYYAGYYNGSEAAGMLFAINPKTQDARISGSLASLCGLEKALNNNDKHLISKAISRIILMQANSIFLGGIPMLFYGDEAGYINDYSFENDPGKSYDNRWAHRPLIDWHKNKQVTDLETVEGKIFSATKKLLSIRRNTSCFADTNNLLWIECNNKHLIAFRRYDDSQEITCIFNYSPHKIYMSVNHYHFEGNKYLDLWSQQMINVTEAGGLLVLDAYQFRLLKKN